jgi:hypothetical protein
MKLPAAAIAAAFASGIALGLRPMVARHASSLAFLSLSFVIVGLLVTTGIALLHVLTDGTRLKISCFVECPEAGSVTGSSMRAEIPNQKQDGEKK